MLIVGKVYARHINPLFNRARLAKGYSYLASLLVSNRLDFILYFLYLTRLYKKAGSIKY